VRVRPRRVRAGKRTRLTFTVKSRRTGKPVRRARVGFARKHRRTGRRGKARMVVRLRRRGIRSGRVKKAGYRQARVRLRVVRPRR
jgi:hypothetical protein